MVMALFRKYYMKVGMVRKRRVKKSFIDKVRPQGNSRKLSVFNILETEERHLWRGEFMKEIRKWRHFLTPYMHLLYFCGFPYSLSI